MNAHDEANRLVETYSPLIMRIGYTYLHSREDAEDVCQETLLKLVRRNQPFVNEEHEKSWIVRVSINACKDLLKSAPRRLSVGLEKANDQNNPEGAPQEDGGPSVLDAVQSLPEAYREPIFLHYCEGYKIAEIAQLTGKSEHAIAKNLSRGRKMLRKTIGKELR